MTLHLHQFICLQDNYAVLLHDSDTGATAAIDAPDGKKILEELQARQWTLTDILLTHHHSDHIQGVGQLRTAFPKLRLVAPEKEAARIAAVTGPIDLTVKENDTVSIGTHEARIIDVPGHTIGHILYHFEDDDLAFVGDTLFSLGCGRVFETTMAVMWNSLSKLAMLPEETQVYCGHECTLGNAHFALSVEPDNVLLQERAKIVESLRNQNKPTIPTTIHLELATNPFLRSEEPELQRAIGMPGADPAMIFAVLRERKNRI